MAVVFPCSSIIPEFCNGPYDRAPHNGRENTKCSGASIGGKWGASRSESFISDQGTLGAQNAEMRYGEAAKDKTTMNGGRKIVDAGLAAVRQDRVHARALCAGRVLGRSNRRLALYGVSPADTGAVPTSADRTGFMAADGCPAFGMQHDGSALPNATSSSTNIPNEDQPVLVSASEC